jgi:hypothetical protein
VFYGVVEEEKKHEWLKIQKRPFGWLRVRILAISTRMFSIK